MCQARRQGLPGQVAGLSLPLPPPPPHGQQAGERGRADRCPSPCMQCTPSASLGSDGTIMHSLLHPALIKGGEGQGGGVEGWMWVGVADGSTPSVSLGPPPLALALTITPQQGCTYVPAGPVVPPSSITMLNILSVKGAPCPPAAGPDSHSLLGYCTWHAVEVACVGCVRGCPAAFHDA